MIEKLVLPFIVPVYLVFLLIAFYLAAGWVTVGTIWAGQRFWHWISPRSDTK